MKRTKEIEIEKSTEQDKINEPEPLENLIVPEIEPEPLEIIEPIPVKPLEPVEPVQSLKQVDRPIRWKKVGGRTFILNNRMIKPGQVFTAKVSEIPKAFRDLIIPVDDLPVEVDELTLIGDGSSFSLQPNGDKWNILNRMGKKLNEVALSRDEALILIKQLL